MVERISLDFQRALTNVEDGVIAVENGDDENIPHFESEARAAFDGVPDEVPYIEEYRNALDDHDFKSAYEALANFAAYVENDASDEYDFSYQQLALERVHDAYREFPG